MGDQNLYKLKLSFTPDSGTPAYKETTFGIRSIEMAPIQDGATEGLVNWMNEPLQTAPQELYNWTFVINGKPMFVKGTG